MFDRKAYMKEYYRKNKIVFIENAKRQNEEGYKQNYYKDNAYILKIIAKLNRKSKKKKISEPLKKTILSISIADYHYHFNYKPSI